MLIPSVIETSARGERAFDIWSLLLKERIVYLGTGIDDQIANVIIAQLRYLEREDPEKDINLYVNSPGGSVTAGLAIYDTMQLVAPEVATYAVGMTASMGTVILCSGMHGKRYCMPNATVHMHQAHTGGISGQAADIAIHAREILRENDIVRGILVKHTGQSDEKIRKDYDRDFFLGPAEAVAYGLVDQVLAPREAVAVATGLRR